MDIDGAAQAIRERVVVTRADIAAAKSQLMSLGHERIDVGAAMDEWASAVAPDAQKPLVVEPGSDPTQDGIAQIARSISARLAVCAAAIELVNHGVAVQAGTLASAETGWSYKWGGQGGGFRWDDLKAFYPEALLRPAWRECASEIFDADLYISRLRPGTLHRDVERALRVSLECFRRDLYLPCAAMLGAASEGSWMEMGKALTKYAAKESSATKLNATLDDPNASTRFKIAKICELYDKPTCAALYLGCGIKNTRLREVQRWSDQVREARNVLHWGSTPTIPDNYEKTAILLMSAVAELAALHSVRDAALNGK